nr:MFS transporter [uncultured Lichenicoccus sp.]
MTERQHALIYLTGATLSYGGTALVPVAMSFAVLDAGYGASGLGLVLAAQSIPTILLLLLGGIAGDHWPRRRIMIAADLLRAGAQAILAGCLIHGIGPLGLMVLVSSVIGIGNAFFQPASGGFLAEIVPREQLGRMNGLLRTGNALAMVIGPAIGGVVVVAIGPGWCIALDAVSYSASAACLMSIRLAAKASSPATLRRSMRGELVEAMQVIRQTRWLCLLLVQYGALNMLAFAPFNVIAPALLSRTSAGAGAWGTLLSGIGMGAVLGALACAHRQPRRLLLGVEAAATMLSVPMFLLAFHAPIPLVVVGCVAFGIGAAMLSVLTITAIQREVAHSMLSRIMAIVQLANIAFNPVGYILAGPVMGLLGAPVSLGLSGLCVIAGVAALLSQHDIRRFELQAS